MAVTVRRRRRFCLECEECGERLDLSQPDPDRPERLLGVCGCGAWWVQVATPAGLAVGRVPSELFHAA